MFNPTKPEQQLWWAIIQMEISKYLDSSYKHRMQHKNLVIINQALL